MPGGWQEGGWGVTGASDAAADAAAAGRQPALLHQHILFVRTAQHTLVCALSSTAAVQLEARAASPARAVHALAASLLVAPWGCSAPCVQPSQAVVACSTAEPGALETAARSMLCHSRALPQCMRAPWVEPSCCGRGSSLSRGAMCPCPPVLGEQSAAVAQQLAVGGVGCQGSHPTVRFNSGLRYNTGRSHVRFWWVKGSPPALVPVPCEQACAAEVQPGPVPGLPCLPLGLAPDPSLCPVCDVTHVPGAAAVPRCLC